MPALRNEQWENLLFPQQLLVFRIKLTLSLIIWSFIWQMNGKSILTRCLLQALHHVRGILSFYFHNMPVQCILLVILASLLGKWKLRGQSNLSKFTQPGRKGAKKYKAPAFLTIYFLPVWSLPSKCRETMCQRPQIIYSNVLVLQIWTHWGPEGRGFVQSHQRQSKVGTGDTPNHTEINHMLGEAREHYYGNLEKRWSF